ncbi:hypothetical protein AC579_5534 [Pseudocercospora musae]|uniref:DUF1772 domain-containing protein n=1 Tax=Pseudocercospora musae TaxID=113226 RepID=A0A139IMA7_9PEZI|nr:hypothetical protein AC579_5534 [Pseudocercospora musae]
MSNPLLPYARFIAIVFPTLYAGVTAQCFTISDSFTFVQPIVSHAPDQKTMARQWLHGYQYGPLWVPPLIAPGTFSNIYLYTSTSNPLYLLAAGLIFSILPITFLYMEPGINGACKWKVEILLREEKDFKAMPNTRIFWPSAHKHGGTLKSRKWAEKTNMKELVLHWRFVNNFRWVIGGVAAGASGWATFSGLA